MAKPAFTPKIEHSIGAWRSSLHVDNARLVSHEFHISPRLGNRVIAIVNIHAGSMNNVALSDDAEGMANVRLIEKAPELFEAVKRGLPYLKNAWRESGSIADLKKLEAVEKLISEIQS